MPFTFFVMSLPHHTRPQHCFDGDWARHRLCRGNRLPRRSPERCIGREDQPCWHAEQEVVCRSAFGLSWRGKVPTIRRAHSIKIMLIESKENVGGLVRVTKHRPLKHCVEQIQQLCEQHAFLINPFPNLLKFLQSRQPRRGQPQTRSLQSQLRGWLPISPTHPTLQPAQICLPGGVWC